jgi:hypothetical protein
MLIHQSRKDDIIKHTWMKTIPGSSQCTRCSLIKRMENRKWTYYQYGKELPHPINCVK